MILPELAGASEKAKDNMQASDWAPEHCQALREYLARGLSFAEIAKEINARFGTAYTRNAALGRSKRMGLAGPERPRNRPKAPAKPKTPKVRMPCQRKAGEPPRPAAVPARPEPVRLRCVGISPRLLPLVELEAGDCRYPYGGDKENEAITFCGHPRLEGSSYCEPHFRLTRGPGTASERAVFPLVLRLVEAA